METAQKFGGCLHNPVVGTLWDVPTFWWIEITQHIYFEELKQLLQYITDVMLITIGIDELSMLDYFEIFAHESKHNLITKAWAAAQFNGE